MVSAAAKRIPEAAWPCTPHGGRRLGTEALEREDEEHCSKNVAHRQPFGIGDYLRGSRPININTLGYPITIFWTQMPSCCRHVMLPVWSTTVDWSCVHMGPATCSAVHLHETVCRRQMLLRKFTSLISHHSSVSCSFKRKWCKKIASEPSDVAYLVALTSRHAVWTTP
jgi:hypothetical protein